MPETCLRTALTSPIRSARAQQQPVQLVLLRERRHPPAAGMASAELPPVKQPSTRSPRAAPCAASAPAGGRRPRSPRSAADGRPRRRRCVRAGGRAPRGTTTSPPSMRSPEHPLAARRRSQSVALPAPSTSSRARPQVERDAVDDQARRRRSPTSARRRRPDRRPRAPPRRRRGRPLAGRPRPCDSSDARLRDCSAAGSRSRDELRRRRTTRAAGVDGGRAELLLDRGSGGCTWPSARRAPARRS